MGVVGVNSDEDRKKFWNILKKKFLNVVKKFFKFTTSSMLVVSYNFKRNAQCLKITEKVSFNIASEASYFYVLNGQKLTKNAKNGPFWRVFDNLKLAVKQCYQTGQFLK